MLHEDNCIYSRLHVLIYELETKRNLLLSKEDYGCNETHHKPTYK